MHVGSGSAERDVPGLSRVLLVEDMFDMRALLRYWLEGDGRFEIVGEAADGAAGVSLAQATQPDVVILDLYLPVLDGLTALAQIRTVAPKAKVVVVSGAGDPADRAQEAMALGAASYVEKLDFLSTLEAATAACRMTGVG